MPQHWKHTNDTLNDISMSIRMSLSRKIDCSWEYRLQQCSRTDEDHLQGCPTMGGKFHPKHSALLDVKKWNPKINHTFRGIKFIK